VASLFWGHPVYDQQHWTSWSDHGYVYGYNYCKGVLIKFSWNFCIKTHNTTFCACWRRQSRKRITSAERRRNRVKIMNSRFKPPSILASWLVNTEGFNIFIVVILVINAVIIGVDVECTLHWPDSFDWLHVTVDIISIIGELAGQGASPNIKVSNDQWCGLRPRSCDKTGLRPTKTGLGLGLVGCGLGLDHGLASLVLVLILVLELWSWSWSCSFGLKNKKRPRSWAI